MRIWSWFVAWRINRKYKTAFANEIDPFFARLREEFRTTPTPALSKLDGGQHERAWRSSVR
jgi:hypothetical protein